MPFEITPDVFVETDDQGIARHLEHIRSPYTAATAGLVQAAPDQLAMQYVRDVAEIYGVPREWLAGLEPPVEAGAAPPDGLFLAGESGATGLAVLSFVQRRFGLPIWEAGIAVNVLLDPVRVTSSRSTLHQVVEGDPPDPAARYTGDKVTPPILARLLGLKEGRPGISAIRLLVYQYHTSQRVDFTAQDERARERTIGSRPVLPLPGVPRSIQEGRHYVVTEALFDLETPGWGVLNWRAFIETRTGAVLYLRAAVSSCTGMVYLTDPISATGNAALTPTAAATSLDPLRTTVTLDGLTSTNPQLLQGNLVNVQGDPAHGAPSEANPPCAFTGAAYSVPSSNFAAVNCYHHLDELYRTIQGFGYTPVTNFFSQTTFPVTAFFQSEAPVVNAHANGNATFTALTNYTFGNADPGATVGIAVDWRVVMHEFNHHILYDRIHNPDYGFAHNGGTALD